MIGCSDHIKHATTMKTSTIVEAKSHFSALLSAVANGEEIIVTRRGQPVARIVPPHSPQVFDLDALRSYIAAGPAASGMTIEAMRSADQL